MAPPEKIAAACDKNTIGVVGILGTTYSGHYEDLAGIDKAISESPSFASQHREALFAEMEKVAGSFVCFSAAGHTSHPDLEHVIPPALNPSVKGKLTFSASHIRVA